MHKDVSFLIISPSNLGVIYDEGSVLNDSLGRDKVYVYFEGIAFLSKEEFSRLEDYHVSWMCRLYQISLNNFGNLKQYAVFYDLDDPNPKEIALQDKIFNPDNLRDNFFILPSCKNFLSIYQQNGGRMDIPVVHSITLERKFDLWGLDLDLESVIRNTYSEESEEMGFEDSPLSCFGGQNVRHLIKNGVIDLNTYIESRSGPLSEREYQNLIISAKYHQKTAYSVQKVIRNQCEISALEFKRILAAMCNFSSDFERKDFDDKFGYDDSKLAKMSLKQLFCMKSQNAHVSSSGKNNDDLAVISFVD